jgi:hypothetical protein
LLTFIDESGTFVTPAPIGSWSTVAALVIPEGKRKLLLKTLEVFKTGHNLPRHGEFKLNQIDESSYINLLSNLALLDVAVFAIALDAGYSKKSDIESHQSIQASKIRENIPLMLNEGGRAGVEILAKSLELLSPQLYAQLVCQTELIYEILVRGTLYYVQRSPQTLGHLRWRIDEKNSAKPSFERTFSWTALGLLQSKSLQSPLSQLEGADYSFFRRNYHPPETLPTHLRLPSGEPVLSGLDLRKLFTENLKFVNSKNEPGVQLADLIASGIRRVLRGEFEKNIEISRLIGKLLVQNSNNSSPINLVSFNGEHRAEAIVTDVVRQFIRHAKPMVAADI